MPTRPLALLLCLASLGPLHAQSSTPSLVFDVATVKASNPNMPGHQFMATGHDFLTLNTTLNDLITYAYGVHTRQVTGGPAWMTSEKFDLNGKFGGETQPTDAQWKTMIQKLLEDCFQLIFHRESRELPVYLLGTAKSGPRLTPSEAPADSLPGIGFRGFGNMPVSNASMADFAAIMQSFVLDRPVLDRTGLTGRYDFTLKWTPDDSQFPGMRPPAPPPIPSTIPTHPRISSPPSRTKSA